MSLRTPNTGNHMSTRTLIVFLVLDHFIFNLTLMLTETEAVPLVEIPSNASSLLSMLTAFVWTGYVFSKLSCNTENILFKILTIKLSVTASCTCSKITDVDLFSFTFVRTLFSNNEGLKI